MNRLARFFARYKLHLLIELMVVLDIIAFVRHRIVTLLMIAIVLNTIACGWVLVTSWRQGKYAIPGSRKAVVFSLLMVLNALVCYGMFLRLQIAQVPMVNLSEPMPSFVWHGFDGRAHPSAELSGKVVAIHFWASWCAPCRKEFPALLAFAKAHPEVTFLTVSADTEESAAEAFVRSVHADVHVASPPNLLYAFDPDNALGYDLFKNMSLPATTVIDDTGRMRRKFLSSVDWNAPDTATYIRSLAP